MRVAGKVAIVTGAARGMGEAHARFLVREGAKVMLTDVRGDEGAAVAKRLGANARFLQHDVTSEAGWARVVAETEAAFGPVSVLVNNAGISGDAHGQIETVELAKFMRVVEVNQVSVFLGMKAVLPSMKKAGGGSMINVSSIAGIVGAPFAHAYIASKFAVRGMTKSAAIEFAPFNIRVNSVHPGVIRTPMFEEALAAAGELDVMLAGTPAKRAGEPEEVAAVVLLLASDESRFTTGAEFVVDGGLTCQ